MSKVRIVAEIGCNHNGSPDLAKKLVYEAARCGVDAVKFQTFSADALISRYAPKAEYQKETTGTDDTQLEMTRALELPHSALLELWKYARGLGLDAFSTPFDLGSVAFLEKQCMHTWKIPAGEVTNLPYLERIGSIDIPDKEIILSTGMATIEEIEECVSILVRSGTQREAIMLLLCNTEYPTPDCDMNLLAIQDLMGSFPGMRVGLSDHSVGAIAAIGGVALGACLVEKHFTLDKNLPGPDHKASATPEELKELVLGVRRMETMLGSKQKVVSPSEAPNKIVARKSIVALRDIEKGELLTEENITCKRPGSGISPMHWYEVLGTHAMRDFGADELIEAEAIPFQM